jgi:3-hydroxyisobutyryl-CoA hydrolase
VGGGVGLSINTPFRVATEKTVFAMPETLIGFFPDVGATYFLPRLDGELGIYLGLTGHQLRAYDTVYVKYHEMLIIRWAGLATHYVPSERLEALESRLAEVNSDDFSKVNAILEEFENGPPKGYHFTISQDIQLAIDRIFSFNDLASIVRNLEKEAGSNSSTAEWASKTLETLKQRSPVSLHVSLMAMRDTLEKSRYHAFQREYELASHFMRQEDFVNGVTARLITRTDPNWTLSPESLSKSMEWVEENIIEKGGFRVPLDETFYLLESQKHDTAGEERGLFKYSLPMEESVLAALMKGKLDGSSGADSMFTRKEFVEFMIGERLGRAGAERKLNYILDMKTFEDVDGKLLWKFEESSQRPLE